MSAFAETVSDAASELWLIREVPYNRKRYLQVSAEVSLVLNTKPGLPVIFDLPLILICVARLLFSQQVDRELQIGEETFKVG